MGSTSSPRSHVKVGGGYPETQHSKTASFPSMAITLDGRCRKNCCLCRPGSTKAKEVVKLKKKKTFFLLGNI